jgi:hypothetical protein
LRARGGRQREVRSPFPFSWAPSHPLSSGSRRPLLRIPWRS